MAPLFKECPHGWPVREITLPNGQGIEHWPAHNCQLCPNEKLTTYRTAAQDVATAALDKEASVVERLIAERDEALSRFAVMAKDRDSFKQSRDAVLADLEHTQKQYEEKCREVSVLSKVASLTNDQGILTLAAKAVADRQKAYGPPTAHFKAVASMWQAYFDARPDDRGSLDERDVGMLMALVKVARDANCPKLDNLVDLAGYARCAEIVSSQSFLEGGLVEPAVWMQAKEGEPACSKCGKFLVFSARAMGSVCGPCSRATAAQDAT